MGHTIVHHLNAHRIPSEELTHSDVDRFLLESTYTDDTVFNADGTKCWRNGILAHGTRDDVEEKIEDVIDGGMTSYRSRKRGPDYFRAGVRNALNDADRLTDATAERIRVRIGCRFDLSKDSDGIGTGEERIIAITDGDPWEEYDGGADVTAQAFATVQAMDGVAQVNALLEGKQEVNAFRNFEVLETPT